MGAGTGPSTGRRTLRVDAGRIAAVVPVAVLLAAGSAVAVGGGPAATEGLRVPDQAVEAPSGASGAALEDDGGFVRVPGGAGPVLPAAGSGPSAQGGSGGQVRIDRGGIPARALVAYQQAERLLAVGDPGCHLDWALVAAIGRVESSHGRFGGNALGTDGVARPGIIGIALDGSRGTARILDTDGGRHDRDTRFDRAVGPMQFIPGTWSSVGVDADRDGARDPQDVDDAAAATGVYLCSGPGDLRQRSDRERAVFRYNHSDEYVRTVLAIADAYARGVDVVDASALPPGARPAGGSAAAQRPSATAAPAPAPAASSPAVAAPPAASPTAPASTAPPVAAPPAAPGVVEGVVGGVVSALPPLPLPVPVPTTPAPAPTTPAPGTPVPPGGWVPGLTCVLEPVLNPLLPVLPLCPPGTPPTTAP